MSNENNGFTLQELSLFTGSKALKILKKLDNCLHKYKLWIQRLQNEDEKKIEYF